MRQQIDGHHVQMTLKHEKKKFLHYIETVNNNPQTWRLKQLMGESIQIKRLLNDMKREGYIDIRYEAEGAKVKRIISVLKHIE